MLGDVGLVFPWCYIVLVISLSKDTLIAKNEARTSITLVEFPALD